MNVVKQPTSNEKLIVCTTFFNNMAKRNATRELNYDNWDEEEETEEAGVFKTASQAVLKERVIKVGKRRLQGEDNKPAQSPFASFGGFGKLAPAKTSKSALITDCPVETTSIKKGSTNSSHITGTFNTTNVKSQRTISTMSIDPFRPNSSLSVLQVKPHSIIDLAKKVRSPEFYGSLQKLNQMVSDHIAHHVKASPQCVLTPIFADYDRHYKGLIEKYPLLESSTTPGTVRNMNEDSAIHKTATPFGIPSATAPTFILPKSGFFNSMPAPAKQAELPLPKAGFFSSGSQNGSDACKSKNLVAESKSIDAPMSLFKFGSTSSSTGSTEFSFNKDGAKPFTFAASSVIGSSSSETTENDDPYVPPVSDHETVQEDNAIIVKRCKVYFKASAEFVSHGIGNIHIKQVDGKVQIIVRADNSLGTIIVNTLFTANMSLMRKGDNGFLIVCVPVATADVKPFPVLLRVKTKADLDELLDVLENLRKQL